jgi:urea carboxylase
MTTTHVPAPMACTVWQHSVSLGQEVVVGSDIISIESMKLEVAVQAPCSGVITYLRPMGEVAEEGETIASISTTT